MTDTPLLEFAHDHVQQIRDAFTRPDDDWLPTLLTECPHGERTIVVLAGGAADALALTVHTVLAHSGAARAVLVVSNWVSRVPGRRPSLDPYREEHLGFYYVSRDGESRYEWAPIVRSKVFPPTLGEFVVSRSVSGRTPDAMRRGMNYGISVN